MASPLFSVTTYIVEPQLSVSASGEIYQVVDSQLGKSAVQGTTLPLAIHLNGDVGVLWEERRVYWDLSITGAKGESG